MSAIGTAGKAVAIGALGAQAAVVGLTIAAVVIGARVVRWSIEEILRCKDNHNNPNYVR